MTDLVERPEGWLQEQIDAAKREVESWPQWLKESMKPTDTIESLRSEITRLQSVDVKRVEDICRLTQERDEARSALSVAQAQEEVLRGALEKISNDIDCEGPGCIHCERDEHPPSWAAKHALEALQSTPPTAVARVIEIEADRLETLVQNFSKALLEKLRAAEKKYGYSDAWMKTDWRPDLLRDIRQHVEKGDPRDVAAYCAFAWFHGWSLADLDGGRKG